MAAGDYDVVLYARVAVLESQQERTVADIHDLRDEMQGTRRDVVAGNRLTIANLVAVLVGAMALVGLLATVRH